ncbi:hypothetical protein G4B88_021778 [Cannabis sativa]|uniref:Methyltransferase domain-containing protein n=1 Tax=Cannabis sativa TaxID=3483 RepID=A0A7J6F2Q2_CANSA|nr:hypothetical protein G4B88_021778 [Cannabis sativa]
MVVSWCGAKLEDCVLDLCCGSGDLAFLLSEKVGFSGKVTGLDFSKEQLSIAASRQQLASKLCYKNIEWMEGDVQRSFFVALQDGWKLNMTNLSGLAIYGMLLLEIISGKKNSSFYYYEKELSLVDYAWQLWNESRGLEVVDDVLAESYSAEEAVSLFEIEIDNIAMLKASSKLGE